MNGTDTDPLRLHEDAEQFREAVTATAAATGFNPRLIEKDYFCTVLLQRLARLDVPLVFKGGTCLAKVHAAFHRLSEDLDFVIPTPSSASRGERSKRVRPLGKLLADIGGTTPGIRLRRPLEGANNSTQHIAVFGYGSLLRPADETIQVEVSLREPLMEPVMTAAANTLLLDPISGLTWAPPVVVSCIGRREAMAEKLRAALSRRDPAIRDFFDVDHAIMEQALDIHEPAMLDLVTLKLRVVGNAHVDVSPARLAALRPQVEAQLRPVLRERDFANFDLDRAFAAVTRLADAVA